MTIPKNSKSAPDQNDIRFRELVDACKDYAIFMLDPSGIITTWSKGAEYIKGYTAEEIIGQHFSRFYLPEDIATHHPDKELEIATKEGRYEEEGWRLRKNGEKFWANIIITALYDKDHKLIGFGKITRDLTERRKIEELKNEFISVVSHELRTPLTSIHGSLNLVLGGAVGALPEKVKKLLDIADNNCSRLIRLVNDILDMQKIEAGKMVFNWEIVDLKKLISSTIAANKMFAEKFGVKIHFEQALLSLKVNADKDRLTQVLTNLLSNAIKFSTKKGLVTVNMSRHGDNVRVCVMDTGCGIAAECRDKVFQKFSQVDTSSMRQEGGTGLGLAISKAIIEKLGGDMDFTSTVNVGSNFYFDLPMCKPPLKKGQVPKLLICEDDEAQAVYFKECLRAAGYKVDIAPTARDAKKLIAKQEYAALFLDLLLPDQDGISLIKDLRNTPNGSKLPIIVVSVIAKNGKEMMNGQAVEVIDWMDKPVDQEQLLKILTNLQLSRKKTHSKILHIEDDIDAQKLVAGLLDGKAEVHAASNIADTQKILKNNVFDLAILDLVLPDGNGMELLSLLAKNDIPIVVLAEGELDMRDLKYVYAALVKGQTSPEQLLKKIENLLRTH